MADDLNKKLQDLQKKLAAAREKAGKDNATDADRQAVTDLEQQVEAANQAVQAAHNAELAAKAKTDDEAAAEKAAAEEAKYVPVLTDGGDRIPVNSTVRVKTTFNGNLRSLEGVLITPAGGADVHGPDVKDGDWITTQFKAGLIEVDSIKKIK